MKLPIIHLARQSDQIVLLRRLYEIGCLYFGVLDVEEAVLSWGIPLTPESTTSYPWMHLRSGGKRVTATTEDSYKNEIEHYEANNIKVNSLDHFISCARRFGAQPKDLDI